MECKNIFEKTSRKKTLLNYHIFASDTLSNNDMSL